MIENEKMLCMKFESEIYQYIDGDLPENELKYWDEHLTTCSKCNFAAKELQNVLNISGENLEEDILDAKYDRMIERAVAKKRSRFLEWLFPQENGKGKIAIALKISVVCGLAVVAIVISLITNRPNPVKTISNELLDWEGNEVNSQMKTIKNEIDFINEDNWNKQIIILDQDIKKLEMKSDKFSFN